MSNARFSILQAVAVSDRRVSDAQFRTLAALGMYADKLGWCYPSLKTLGKDLGKSKQAVGRDTIALRKLGYLEVKNRYDPNTKSRHSNLYRLKYDLPDVNVDDTTPSTPEVDALSTPEVDVNAPSNDPNKNFSLSGKDLEQVNAKVDYILATNDQSKAWQGRELIRADLLEYADWYNRTTGQVMPKRAQKAWWKALSDWKAEGLTISDLQEAYTARVKWRNVITDPNELTKDAAAIHALPSCKKDNSVPVTYTAEGIPESW